MRKCKYAKKHTLRGYVLCERDGSMRKRPCDCPHFELSWLSKFYNWLFKY